MPRLHLLSSQEEKQLNIPPIFNEVHKKHFFSLPDQFKKELERLDTDFNEIVFIIFYGYFKSTNRFFDYTSFHQCDIDYVSSLYNLKKPSLHFKPSERSYRRYKQIIRSYFDIQHYNQAIKKQLQVHAINLANNFIHPKKIFFELLNFSKKLNIEIPSYTTLSQIISQALNYQKRNIIVKLEQFQSDKQLDLLDEFLDKDENHEKRYNLHHFKKLEHSTKKNQMLLSFNRLETIQSKFKILLPIIDAVGINEKIARYYATWVQKSQMLQLTRKNELEVKFLLLSFIHHQYYIRLRYFYYH